eukprot:gene12805-12933_t
MGLMDLIDRGQDALAERITSALHPQIHTAIDSRVDAFRDSTLQAIPQQCESGLKGQADSSSVAWLLNKVLGDNTDVLVAQLVERFRPGITSATDGLSSQATDYIIAKLKDLLDGRDPVTGEVDMAAADGASQGIAQLQVEEVAAETEPEIPAEGEADEQRERSFGSSFLGAVSAVSGMVSTVFNAEDKLPAFESAAKELVHPLFEQLKTSVWELVPATLQDVLDDLITMFEGLANSVCINVLVQGADEEGGLGDWISSKLSGRAGSLLNKVLSATLDMLDGPMQQLIGQLVDECEHSSLDAAFKSVREKLADYQLISADAAAAEPSVV